MTVYDFKMISFKNYEGISKYFLRKRQLSFPSGKAYNKK